MTKTREKKAARKARRDAQNPIYLAHKELDAWIKGEIGGNHDGPYQDQIGPGDIGVINLGKLQRTMVLARKFYIEHQDILQAHKALYQSDHAGKRPEPRTTPATAAAVTTENERGECVPAIPLPFYSIRKHCTCGKRFWRESSYRAHYALEHIVLGTQPL